MITLDQVKQIVAQVSYKDWQFFVELLGTGYYVQIKFMEKDAYTGKVVEQHGRKWYISSHTTPDEIVRTCFLAVMIASEHEIRETFAFKGKNLFGPHIDLEALHEVSDIHQVREEAQK